jgi:4-hydroxybenzoate polyprenyltransferase
MTLRTLLKLGRVSNLPTVWTNALAGAVLAGATLGDAGTIALAALILSFFYVGGMWLNDAFDAEIDARERANRPIPRGEIGRGVVFIVGFALLAIGMAAAFLLGEAAGLAGIALAGLVVLYDWLHKRTVLSPVIMGSTRFFCYGLAALAVGAFAGDAFVGAAGLFAWVVGLTYAAKQEAYDRLDRAWPLAVLAIPVVWALWQAWGDPVALAAWVAMSAVVAVALRRLFRRAKGDVPKAVVTLIAGMSLYDATLIAGAGAPVFAAVAAAGFLATLALQRIAPGT